MKFLLDQDVYALTERFLREQEYDVITASQLGLSGALDTELLNCLPTCKTKRGRHIVFL